MWRELRMVGFVVLAAIAASLLDTYNKQSAKPIPMPLPIADETKPEPTRTVRVVQIYKTPSDQVPDEPTTVPVLELANAFPETTTSPLPLPSPSPSPHHKKQPLVFVSSFICTKLSPKMVRVGDV
jgi:hypothetical protein